MSLTALSRLRRIDKISISKKDVREYNLRPYTEMFAFYQAGTLQFLGKAFRKASTGDLQDLKKIIPAKVVDALIQKLALNQSESELFLQSFLEALDLHIQSVRAIRRYLGCRLKFHSASEFAEIIEQTVQSRMAVFKELNAVKVSVN